MVTDELDGVDRGILHLLQEDARNNSATAIAEQVRVTANTVRNRIRRLEERGIIDGYVPLVKYEPAGYQLKVSIRCTASVPERSTLAREALDVVGVVAVRELMTGRGNVEVTVVAAESDHVTQAANDLTDIGLDIVAEELVKTDHTQPFDHFGLPEAEN